MRRLSVLFILQVILNFTHIGIAADSWPSESDWEALNKAVDGKLLHLGTLMENCDPDGSKKQCLARLQMLRNPFEVQELPWLTLSVGWLDAWNMSVSPYAVAAETTDDLVAAVKFAKKHGIKLVIKGAAHDYLGRSCAPNSLLAWTHKMRNVSLHESFVPTGAPEELQGVPAMTAEAGALWTDAYDEVTTKNGRYVQGGGCPSVGVAGGFLQGGGFGSFSRKYGTCAGSLLEAEVILADGEVVLANEYQYADLFWALKGGGGSTFGLVTKVTLETHPLPSYFGLFQGKIVAENDKAYTKLLEQFIHFYRSNLNNEYWGEQIILKPENSLDLFMFFQGLSQEEVENVWKPFFTWVQARAEYSLEEKNVFAIPAQKFWDYNYLKSNYPEFVERYLTGTGTMFYWLSNADEVLDYWYAYGSRWIPTKLFESKQAKKFAKLLFQTSRFGEMSLHFNKGLAHASSEARKSALNSPINPVVLDSPALFICGAQTQELEFEKDTLAPVLDKKKQIREKINAAMRLVTKATPGSGSYSNETDYFQENWQEAFWGEHYARLLEIKRKYDPDNFFNCHHSVGSE